MLVYWWFVSVDSAGAPPAEGIVYDLKSGKWGTVSGFRVTDVLNYAIDTGFVGIANRESIHVMSDGRLCELTGDAASGVMRLGWMGDDLISPTLTKLRPRFLVKPTTATADFYKAEDPDGADEKLVGTATLREGAFGTQQNAHWHSARMTIPGVFEISAVGNDIPRPGGKR